MMKSWISTLLIILIASQSVMAVADVHLEHQSNTQHPAANFIDDSVDGVGSNTDHLESSSATSSTAIDCQHCCHCHSPQFNPLGTIFSAAILTDSEKHVIDLNNTAPFSLASPLFKPPRAQS